MAICYQKRFLDDVFYANRQVTFFKIIIYLYQSWHQARYNSICKNILEKCYLQKVF